MFNRTPIKRSMVFLFGLSVWAASSGAMARAINPHRVRFSDAQTVRLTLSNTELNRFQISGDTIEQIRCPAGRCVQSSSGVGVSSTPNSPELNTQLPSQPASTGGATLRFVGTAPFTLYVDTTGGHHLGVRVYLKKRAGVTTVFEPLTPSVATQRRVRAAAYHTRLANLIRALATHHRPDEFVDVALGAWNGGRLRDIAVHPSAAYRGLDYVGLIFSVKNHTHHRIRLFEAQFYHPGVAATALSKQWLNPGEQGALYQVVALVGGIK